MTLVRAPKTKGGGRGGSDDAASAPRVGYAEDAYSWALQQAEALRTRRFDLIDADNLADEIDALAKSDMRVTRSAVRLVLHHLLKWDHQPSMRSRSRMLSVREHRRDAARQLDDNPGLRPQIPRIIEEAYADARDAALRETGLPEAALALACPYSWDEIMTRPIAWPQSP